MKNTTRFLFFIFIFLFASCSAKQLPPPKATYKEGAIKIHVKADPKLNLSDGLPHSLMLCVYQLKDPNAFNNLAGDQDGLSRLLDCNSFDASAVGSERLIIQPGQDMTYNLGRAEGAKYVAVVAGYSSIKKEKILRLYEIPVVIEKKGLIFRTEKKKLGKLRIELKLGPQQIE